MNISRKLQRLPHDDRPFWGASDPHSDLQYLGWGMRDFGNYPDSSDRVSIWSYNVILRGSPMVMLPEGPVRLTTGQAIVASPAPSGDFGFRDEPHRYTEILVWTWRSPPLVASLRPAPGGYKICKTSEEALDRLQAAHLRCRQEMENPDELTPELLRSIRFEIDAELARCLFGTRMRNDQQLLVEAAVRWMHRHLDLRNPISVLCRYLQVSPSTLERVFDAVLKVSPSAYYLNLRMQAAQKRMAGGKVSIKRIAYELGYKHPGDFSRAFKAYQRKNARTGFPG